MENREEKEKLISKMIKGYQAQREHYTSPMSIKTAKNCAIMTLGLLRSTELKVMRNLQEYLPEESKTLGVTHVEKKYLELENIVLKMKFSQDDE
jgi:hypothetical protein